MQEQLKSIENLTQFVAEQVVDTRDDVKYIKNFCKVLESRLAELRPKKQLDMPPKPAIFFGRDGLVKKVSTILSSSETASHICLLGPGGMGKTSLSLAIVGSDLVQAKFQKGHRVWVPCLEATSASLFLQVLYTSLRVERKTDSVISDILYELKSSNDPHLLLLDNFETPWTTSDGQKQVEEVLSKLNQLSHVSILITMRGSHPPTVDVEWHSEIVPAMDKDASLRICQRFNPHWKMNADLDRLLDDVECMPFAVTLMATRGCASGSSPTQLLERSTRLGTGSESLESGTNRSISLPVNSNFAKSKPDGTAVAATLSLLPAGTVSERLAHWDPNVKSASRSTPTLSRSPLLQTATRDGDRLLDESEKGGPNTLANDRLAELESSMDKSISLSVDSELVTNDPNGLNILAALSMLPAGTTTERLAHWALDLKSLSSAIATLSKAALLQTISQDGEETLSVLPVVQSFMLRHNRIPKPIQRVVRLAFCQYVLDHACRYRDPTFKVNAEVLAREDINIQSILVGDIDHTGCDDRLVRALLAFSWYRRDTKPLITVAQHTLLVARANGNKLYIAEALLCLGSSYSEVTNFVDAKGVLEESFQLLTADESSQSQQLSFECALARLRVAVYLISPQERKRPEVQRWHQAERMAMANFVLTRTKDSDAYWHACALEALGWLHLTSGVFLQGMNAFVEAAEVMKGLGCNRDRALALYGKAYSLNHGYFLDEVVHWAIQEALEVAECLEPSYVHGNILLLLGQVFIRMGRLVDAMNSFEKCLGIYRYIGVGLGVAQAFDFIGFVYLHTGAYSDAHPAFEAASEAYASLGETLPDAQTCMLQCKQNMEYIRLKNECPGMRIGFSRPRGIREIFLFYPDDHCGPL